MKHYCFMRKKWSKEEDAILLKNYKISSNENLSIILTGRTISSIINRKNQLYISKKWTKEEDEIIKKYFHDTPAYTLVKLLNGRTYKSILSRAFILNVKSKDRTKRKHRYKQNDNFFHEYNTVNCYWAGFIAADGFVDKNKSYLSIKISKNDIHHLIKFKKVLKSNAPILTNNNCVILTIYSKKIVQDLESKFNIINKKSLIYSPPTNLTTFNEKLSFIVGVIDGDGSILNLNNKLRIVMLGTYSLMSWCKDFFNTIESDSVSLYRKDNIYVLTINKLTKIQAIFNYVNSLKLPFLIRKWEKIK